MTAYLVFTLSAAMAAMGDLAGHERRGTLAWPGRSAVLGLVAAAQGIRRADAAGLARLEGLRVAVGVLEAGEPLRDYHTVQTVPTAAAKRPDSRPAAIAAAGRLGLNTTITLRDYRVGVAYAVALWGAPLDAPSEEDLSLRGLAASLERPVFTLYFGRKSCPLSAPPAPRLLQADDVVSALRQAARPPFQPPWQLGLVASDERIQPDDVEDSRNDRAIDRDKWHFASRRVYMHRPVEGGLAG